MENSKELLKMIEYPNEGILSKPVISAGKTDVTLFCMAKGAMMSEHTSKKEGVIYILEGDGIFTLEGKEIKMIPGTIIHMKKNAVHSLFAKKNTCFVLILF